MDAESAIQRADPVRKVDEAGVQLLIEMSRSLVSDLDEEPVAVVPHIDRGSVRSASVAMEPVDSAMTK